jgi:hypothetical protein
MYSEKPANAAAAAVVNPIGDDVEPVTPGDELLRRALVIGVCLFYAAALGFLAVMWLSFGHSDLKDIVIGGFFAVSNLTTAVAGHYLGAKTATDASRPTLYRTRKAK